MAGSSPRSGSGALRGKRVLVVEGRHMIASGFARWLRDGDVEVVGPVTSVQDALELIAAGSVLDAALLDPSLDEGWAAPIVAALERLGVPFVFVSGYDPWEERGREPPCGVLDDRKK